MSTTVTSQQLKKENSEISSENNDDNDLVNSENDDEDSKSNKDLNYALKPNVSDDDCDGDDIENKVTKTKNSTSTTTMPEDLSKSDKISKYNNEESVNDNYYLENSTKSSWQYCEGGFTEEDVYMVSGAGQTLPSSSLQITSIDGFFNRKRGRPPKNRFVEVYKNTHQKPQAIFTSFKLEKQGASDATSTNYENCFNQCLQNGVETITGGESENNIIEYSRHKPNMLNSTHRKRLNKVNATMTTATVASTTMLSTHCGSSSNKNVSSGLNSKEDVAADKTYHGMYNSTNTFDGRLNSIPDTAKGNSDDKESLKSLFSDSLPSLKKPKIVGSSDNVTVIRAAGTFYPENSHGNSNIPDNCKKKSVNVIKEKGCNIFSAKEEQQVAVNSLYHENNVAQNLSLKDCDRTAAENSSVLPQIFNVLQLQQQLFAFYQQMALMTPTFSHLDLKNFLVPTLTPATLPPTSETSVPPNETDCSLPNKDLVNLLLSLQNHQEENQTASNDLMSNFKSEKRKRQQINEQFLSCATTAIRDPLNSSPPALKVTESEFSYPRERTPSGYLRFRFNEDCGYAKCGYRQHQSHFHCNRPDCQYSFCDKTRFVQHTARHERLDTLMGSDFQQYRANMSCNYSSCPYGINSSTDLEAPDVWNGRKSSHFHCLKCPFVCADTNKVVAHRRLHNKMEFIRLAGFRKVNSNENCMISNSCEPQSYSETKSIERKTKLSPNTKKPLEDQLDTPHSEIESYCPYALRHAHYHCLVCNCSVLSRSQLMAHKHRSTEVTTHATPPLTSATSSDLFNVLHILFLNETATYE